MKDKLQKELETFTQLNETMKSAALMVGFNVEEETKKALGNLDQRVRLNLWQSYVIKTIKMLLED